MGGPPGEPGGFRSLSRRAGSGREALPKNQRGWDALPEVCEGS